MISLIRKSSSPTCLHLLCYISPSTFTFTIMTLFQTYIPPTPPNTSIAGRTVIVTGGNAGLGFEASRQLLVLGAGSVIIAVRSLIRGVDAVSRLKNDPEVKEKNPEAKVEAWALDLDDYSSAIAFANKVTTELKVLDLLLLNVGVNLMRYETSKSGHERVMQINCWTNFILAIELLPLLRATSAVRGKASRLVISSFEMHASHSLTKVGIDAGQTVYGHFDDKTKYSKMYRYPDSKLAVVAFVEQLATHVPASEVIINNVTPGMCLTDFDKNLPFGLKQILWLARRIMARTAEEGARTYIYAAEVADAETHGRYIANNQVDPDGYALASDVSGQ
ncbi:Dehydrogenases with different specificities (related to short-chain alcohol dehydrogenases) [Phaffia rhodozyma]|uniref:Dehydrogenases with different specificities (Related to short-chain alcohol dehydrogenases) n=1 Tax=Phaffia rhodozyma TaxID=264483 RepID=A0A0F7SG10_PHARH|nr:Dehydrogenases with different specificities (related to short-chain alcohol dehydrogenases) [Phaffia rhodozyma]